MENIIEKAKDKAKKTPKKVKEAIKESARKVKRKTSKVYLNANDALSRTSLGNAPFTSRVWIKTEVDEITQNDPAFFAGAKKKAAEIEARSPRPDAGSKEKLKASRTDSGSLRQEGASETPPGSRPQSKDRISTKGTLAGKKSGKGARKQRQTRPEHGETYLESPSESDNSPVTESVENLPGSFGGFVDEPVNFTRTTSRAPPSSTLSSGPFGRPEAPPLGTVIKSALRPSTSSSRPSTVLVPDTATTGKAQTADKPVPKWRRQRKERKEREEREERNE